MPMTGVFSHQVPMIFFGPSRRTVIPCGHHQHWATWLDKADNTGSFMVVDISFENSANESTYLIFSAVHISPTLDAISVSVILWIMRKAKVVCTTSKVIVILSTHYTCMEQTENNHISSYSHIIMRCTRYLSFTGWGPTVDFGNPRKR